jgi:hypothetical protein
VYQLTAPASLAGERFDAGAWVIPTDQEFAALAREVLDVQAYPDIRESPGGPLETPYDAAGWTLPLQMGVTMRIATTPLSAEVRASMKLLGQLPAPAIRPAAYNMTPVPDAAGFDSAPGIGFDSDPAARAIVPPAGRITGSGPSLAVNPAENNAFKAINRAWRAGASVRYEPGADGAGGRYVISGLTPAVQDEMVAALALRAERVGGQTGVRPGSDRGQTGVRQGSDRGQTRGLASASCSPTRAWTRGGRAGCSINMNSST